MLSDRSSLVKLIEFSQSFSSIIKWWKKKATKRYERLKDEGRFRNEVELWTEDDNIQIIR